MSADRETNRIVRAWLEEGVSALPDRVLDTVLDELPATPQRRASWPVRRFGEMNRLHQIRSRGCRGGTGCRRGNSSPARSGHFTGGPGRARHQPPSSPQTPAPIREGALAAGSYLIRPFSQPGECGLLRPPPQPDCIDSDQRRLSSYHVQPIPDGLDGRYRRGLADRARTPARRLTGASLLFVRWAPRL